MVYTCGDLYSIVITVIIAIPIILVMLFTLYWIPKFYKTISYKWMMKKLSGEEAFGLKIQV